MTDIKYPENNDLRSLIRFSSDDGLIWLDQNRMVLMHAAALGELRKELIESIGQEQARRILTRAGYAAGVRDAEIARRIRGDCSAIDAFVAGPQLHMLEGSVNVEPVRIEMDTKTGHFDGEFIWGHSWEAEVHLQEFGHAHEPVCWMQIGYASGYTSAFMGRFILFRETECAATGTNDCRIVGKPVEDWPDADQYLPYFQEDSMVGRLLELREQVETLRSTICERKCAPDLIGASAGFQTAYGLINKAAATNVTVLLLGQTGVGKERFARTLHELSPRAKAPFVAVNCAALPHDLIESELFGVEKGAFTGAHASRMGKFERADGGTLFLDEVGELPLAAQAKLLRVLQEGEIERLGDERVRKINVRLVTATNVDLQSAVKQGRFRSDLYYRLNVYPVTIPSLRERVSDIPLLVEAMVARFCAMHEKKLLGVTDKAMRMLKAYAWPGNIRELENIIERGVILTPQYDWIQAEHLFVGTSIESTPDSISDAGTLESGAPAAPDARTQCKSILETAGSLDEVERMLLQYAVEQSAGNLSGAARLLGITRPQLSYRLKKS
ncbi:MAG: sigma-54-dependent Fis family transcriptional regulator [Rhodocyclaceae bacterium]|nr:sigma-54-dependent Fis family transcriptional regulator [Rhodocyclaceae bacterium]MCB1911434.1 sigma-54-dependent Fis family transcriptional regulator [Rhodocyclaceae bacterium]MCP5240912.1 sigma-54-dependent Fis family transcriptional regulator [Zoogloeaceae bacterium]MCP5294770.1 sigma-54-dependent Fis family transcriptional regulator [Zoogloeaceae bacterium]